MLLAFNNSRRMKSNNTQDDRQIHVHVLMFLRMTNTNKIKQLFNLMGG